MVQQSRSKPKEATRKREKDGRSMEELEAMVAHGTASQKGDLLSFAW